MNVPENPPREWPMPPRVFALTLIVLLGIVLRVFDLGSRSLWWDESNTMRYSEWFAQPAKLFDSNFIIEAPLLPVLVHFWNLPFADLPRTNAMHDWWLRLLPCIFGVASMPLLYALARRLTASDSAALMATLLFAIAPFQIRYAQELRIYSLHVLCGLAAVHFLFRVFDNGRTRDWLGLFVCEVLLFYGHYISVWILVCLHAFFVFHLISVSVRARRSPAAEARAEPPLVQLRRWFLMHLLMVVLFIPGLYHAWCCNQHMLHIEITWYPALSLKTLYITFTNFYYGFGPQAWAYKPLVLLALALSIFGLVALAHPKSRFRNPRSAAFLALLVFGLVFLNWFMWRIRDFQMYEDRLYILSATLSYIAIGMGLAALPRLLRRGALAAFIALSLPGLYAYYTGELHPQREHRIAVCDKVDFRSAAVYLESQWQDGDLLAHDSNFTYYPMRYYFPYRQAHLGATPEDAVIYTKAMGYADLLRNLGSLPVLAEDAVKDAKRIWYIEAFGVTADDVPQTQSIGDWLRQRFILRETQVFDGVRLYLFEGRKAESTHGG